MLKVLKQYPTPQEIEEVLCKIEPREKIEQIWKDLFDSKYTSIGNNESRVIYRDKDKSNKYRSGLTFIFDEISCLVEWTDISPYPNLSLLGFDAYNIKCLRGKFYLSRKTSSPCFFPDDSGEHVLVCTKWNMKKSDTIGNEFPMVKYMDSTVWAKNAKSISGRTGRNYYVIDIAKLDAMVDCIKNK